MGPPASARMASASSPSRTVLRSSRFLGTGKALFDPSSARAARPASRARTNFARSSGVSGGWLLNGPETKPGPDHHLDHPLWSPPWPPSPLSASCQSPLAPSDPEFQAQLKRLVKEDREILARLGASSFGGHIEKKRSRSMARRPTCSPASGPGPFLTSWWRELKQSDPRARSRRPGEAPAPGAAGAVWGAPPGRSGWET